MGSAIKGGLTIATSAAFHLQIIDTVNKVCISTDQNEYNLCK